MTPDGRRAVSGSDDETLRVWDLESGRCLRTLEGHSSGVRSVSVTPDGRRAVSGSDDETLRVWDVESGQPRTVVKGTAPWEALAFSARLNRAVGGTRVGEVSTYDLVGVPLGPGICTASRVSARTGSLSIHCPWCNQESAISSPAVALIVSNMDALRPGQSPCLDLPDSAFSDARLLGCCPHCTKAVRLNPFAIEVLAGSEPPTDGVGTDDQGT